MKKKSTNTQRHGIKSLALILGESPNTVRKYLRMEGAPKPDTDKRYRQAEVARWIDYCRKGGPAVAAAKAETEAHRLELARLELQRAQAGIMTTVEAFETSMAMIRELRSILIDEFESVAFVRGLRDQSVVEITQRLAAAYDRTVNRYRSGALPLKAEESKRAIPAKLDRARIDAEMARIELAKAKKEVLLVDDIAAVVTPAVASLANQMEVIYEHDLPRKLRGLPPVQMHPLLTAARCGIIHAMARDMARCLPHPQSLHLVEEFTMGVEPAA
jgi:hypothetical protein